jgi:hypothetical protein
VERDLVFVDNLLDGRGESRIDLESRKISDAITRSTSPLSTVSIISLYPSRSVLVPVCLSEYTSIAVGLIPNDRSHTHWFAFAADQDFGRWC